MTRRLAQVATRRIAVLVVTVPGWDTTRFAVERALRQRGWREALSPADADALVVCGPPGPRLARAVDLVWEQLPGPRARVTAMAPSTAGAALDQAVADLLDDDRQRRDASGRSTEPAMGTPPNEDPDDGGDDGDDGDEEAPAADHGDEEDTPQQDHGDTDHGDMDMDMDHGDMDMSPGGIPLAEGGADDRDGLDLDVLHLPLGPVLPCWPAGLLLHCTVHGDVVMQVRAEVLGAAGGDPTEPPSAAALVDRAAQLLTLAGWEAAAADAVRVRDGVLDGDPATGASLDRLVRRVGRSRLLRWSLRGVGHVDPSTCRELGLDGRLAGDVHDRLLALLTGARTVLGGDGTLPAPVPLDVLADVLPGRELGAVRLTVGSLGLDPTVRRAVGAGAS